MNSYKIPFVAKSIFLTIICLAISYSSSAQVIFSDSVDYQPGSDVTLYGDGWNAFEVIDIKIKRYDSNLVMFDDSTSLTLTANASGEFSGVSYSCTNTDLGKFFQVSAIGQSSNKCRTTTFNDGGGDYSIDYSGYDPTEYTTIIYSSYTGTPPTGYAVSPLGTKHSKTVESMSPANISLGQIVAFEFYLEVVGSPDCDDGLIKLKGEWDIETTNGGNFGYNSSYQVIAAFVNTGSDYYVDPTTGTNNQATVTSFSSNLHPDRFEGTFYVSGVNADDKIPVEVWVVLDATKPAGVGGNVQSQLKHSDIDGGTPSGSCNHDHINVGSQTVPLLQVQGFCAIASLAANNVSCFGLSDGSIVASSTGGSAPFTYLWNDGSTSATRTGLAPGTYSVTVTDATGCADNGSVTITQPPSAISLSSSQVDNLCFGDVTGSIDLTATGGTSCVITGCAAGNDPNANPLGEKHSYWYKFENMANPGTYETISGTSDGNTPSVTVFGKTFLIHVSCSETYTGSGYGTKNGPSVSDLVRVVDYKIWKYHSDGSYRSCCSGTPIPSPTVGAYTYVWSGVNSFSSTTEDISSLSSGPYTVTVTDCNNCSATTTVTILPAVALTAAGVELDPVSCFGLSDGSATVTPSGGTAPYTITPAQTGLSAGTHTFTITDANLCVTTVEVTITEPTLLTATGVELSPVSCFGLSDGSATVTPAGGTTPYTITPAQTGLSTGTHTFTITDSNLCVTTVEVTITEPQLLTATGVELNPVSCFGLSDGSATITPTGGTVPYTITPAQTGLSEGTHTFTITDSNLCVTTVEVTITEPALLIATGIELTLVSCLGSNDGSATVTPTGGTAPYAFLWAASAASQITIQASGLSAGSFSVTVTDSNSCTATTTITINTSPDVTPPSIVCPADITVGNDPGICGAEVTYTPPIGSDDCPGSTTVLLSGLASGSVFPVGITTVTYQVTDTSGNVTTCNFDVTVNDTEDPTITCPANITLNNDAGICGAIATWTAPTGNDNCGVASVTSDIASGTTFNVGTTTVTYTVTDIHGNVSNCSFDVTVTDDEAPLLTCTSDISQTADGASCDAAVTIAALISSDNCGIASVVNDFNGTADASDTYPVGTTTVIWTVTDIHGNVSNCSFDVTVTDDEAPLLTCTSDITQTADLAKCDAAVTIGALVSSDNCGIASIVNDFNGTADASDTYPVGTTTVIWTVTDIHGNVSNCSFDVTVTDDEAPLLTCTSDITQTADLAKCDAAVTIGALVSSDNCGIASIVNDFNGTANASDTYPVGTTTVIWTVTDIHGNVSNCSFDVTVTDDEAPLLTCTSDITQTADGASCDAGVTIGALVSSDNCGIASIVNDFNGTANASDTYPVGTTTVIWTVTDIHGNVSNCSFDVIITDDEAPLLTCTSDITQTADGASCDAAVTIAALISSDNCGIASIVNDFNGTADASDTYPVGTTTVIWTVTDIHGNVSNCSFDVTVTDDEAPVLTCTSDISQTADGAKCDAAVTIAALISSDNCGIASVVNDFNGTADASDTYPVGTTTVIWTVTDIHGNVSNCSFDVTVTDDEAPTAICQAVSVTLSNGVATITPGMVDGGSYDNCGISTMTVSEDTWSCEDIGEQTVTLTVTDIHGLVSTCTATVTIVGDVFALSTTPTNVDCNGNSTGAIDLSVVGGTPASYLWSTGATTEDISNLPPGTYTVTVTTVQGCTTEISETITEPDVLGASIDNWTNELCIENDDGTATVTPIGGTLPYSFLWSDGQTTATAIGLSAGIYSVVVTDASGCVFSGVSVTITEPAMALSSSIQAPIYGQPICGAHIFNTLSSEATGGTGNLTFQWSLDATATFNGWSIVNSSLADIEFIAGTTSATFTLVVTDDNGCQSTSTYSMQSCSDEYYCSYTKGFYGNTGGLGCTQDSLVLNAYQMMYSVMSTNTPYNFGDYYGSGPTDNYFQLTLGDIVNSSIFNMLPGGSKSLVLDGFSTYSDVSTWGGAPLSTKNSSYGSIKNNLLAQTITYFFNMEQNPNFENVTIAGANFVTANMNNCGPGAGATIIPDTFEIPNNVVTYLMANNTNTVGGLFDLANLFLANDPSLHLSGNGKLKYVLPIGDITKAVDAFNRGFDGCRILNGFYTPSNKRENEELPETVAEEDVNVVLYPNPSRDHFTVIVKSAMEEVITLVVYDMAGNLVQQMSGQTSYNRIEVGHNLATGIYMVKITQGDYTKYIRTAIVSDY